MTLILVYEPKSLLQKRFAKTSVHKESFVANVFKNLQELLKPLAQKNVKSSDYMSRSKKLLLQAGYASSEDDVLKYDMKRLTYTVFSAGIVLWLLFIDFSADMLLVSILSVYVVYKFPEMKLKREIKNRQKEFMRYLPDAVDLLSICVQAGLGIDAAFSKVAEEFVFTSKIVAMEFERLNQDLRSGLSHEDAYKNLVLRNDSQDLQSLAALLIQSDRLGTSITQSLEAFCDSMRTKKRQRIEELSQQASTKMTVPMVLFMLPAIFIVIMYPAIQKIMAGFGK